MRTRTTELYREWIASLTDQATRARIRVRINRLVHGNPGTHRGFRGGIFELEVDCGPGYRVYHAIRGNTLVILAGGDKSTQQSDIRTAIALSRTL